MTQPPIAAAILDEGRRLLDFARLDPDRTVPHYPGWSLGDLVRHAAPIMARTATIARTLPQERIPLPTRPSDLDAFEWYETSLVAMVEALSEADPDADVWTFIRWKRIGAWERRMLIEIGVHRWDAQQAIEEPEPLLPIVSGAGLDEFTDQYLGQLGEVPTLEVEATDLDRSWVFGQGQPTAHAVGTASDLYLRLVARPGVELPRSWQQAIDSLAKPERQAAS